MCSKMVVGVQIPFDPSEMTAVATTYRLIARLWLKEIDPALARELSSDPLRMAYVGVGGTPPPTDGPSLETLAEDYCHLFVGPCDHLPPIQSVWQSGTLQGAAADAMQSYLRLIEWTPREAIVDHIGVQLNVMSILVDQFLIEPDRPRPAADDEHVREFSKLTARFFQDHVAWSESLAVRVQSKAKSEFYRSVGRVTEQFLISESIRLGESTG